MNTNRIPFLDYLRVTACFLVMLVHAAETFYGADSSGLAGPVSMLATENNRFWVAFWDGAFGRVAVPLFMMVSSYLLAPMPEQQTMNTFYRHRFMRILPPMITFLFLYTFLPLLWGGMTWEQSMADLQRIPFNFPSMAGHLWFMYPLISLYLIIPVLSPWLRTASARDERLFIYLFAFSTLTPWLHRFVSAELWGECFWNPFTALWYCSGFIGYLVLAHYVRFHLHWSRQRRLAVGAVCFVVGAAFTAWSFWLKGVPGEIISTPMLEWSWEFCTPNVLLATFGLFLLFTCIQKKESPVGVAELSRLSFGMYLMHLFFLAPIAKWMVAGDVASPLLPVGLAIPVIAMLTFLFCALATKVLSFLPGSKYLFGTCLATLCVMFCTTPLFAQIVSDKAYRIESVAAPGKSLMTKNSSLDTGVDVVIWTETHVPSQCWTPAIGSTTIIRNVYSNHPLATPSTAVGAALRQARSGAGRWILEPVDEEALIYKIKASSKELFVTLNSTDDGSVPVLAAASDDANQLWHFIEVEPQTTFTAAMREEMFEAYIKSAVESKGSNRKTFGGGGWGESEQLEVVLDAYETTGNEEYLKLAQQVYTWFNTNVGSRWDKYIYTDNYHWFGHDFNDDVVWQIIAVARMGLLTNKTTYINAAKRNFDIIYERAYIPFTGLMRWAQSSGDPYGTNSCINGPAEVAACYLGFAGCGEEYFEKARDLYAAQRYVLANNMSSGKVWDNVVWDPATEQVKSKNEWASTYNQGTMLGAACMLYKYYGDEQYLKDAQKIMTWTKNNLCDSHGIVNVCQGGSNHDLWGFKGILMRYVRRFIRDCHATTYQAWMEKNAMHAYCNRTPQGITPTAWLQKGDAENTSDDFGNSTAASAAVNVMFPDDPPLPYEEKAKDDHTPPDAINHLRTSESQNLKTSAIYDLTGHPVRCGGYLRPGLYILNGKKTIIK